MDDVQIRQLLADTLPAETPPSTLEPDTLTVRGRRALRRRRLSMLGGSLAVATVVAIGGTAAAGALPHGHGDPAVPAASPAGPSTSAGPTHPATTDTESREHAIRRLNPAYRKLVRAALPGARFTADAGTGGLEPLVFGPVMPYGLRAAAVVTDAKGTGTLLLTLTYRTDPAPPCKAGGDGGRYPGGTTTCRHTTVHGQSVEIGTTEYSSGAVELRVRMTRADGTRAYLVSMSYLSNSSQTTPPKRGASAPPLTASQAVAIAGDPTLSYHSVRTG